MHFFLGIQVLKPKITNIMKNNIILKLKFCVLEIFKIYSEFYKIQIFKIQNFIELKTINNI